MTSANCSANTSTPAIPAAAASRAGGCPPPPKALPASPTQLGQALAGLDAFEVGHTVWNADLKCFAWQLGPDDILPVRRLRPELLRAPETDRHSKTAEHMRQKIIARFRERYEEGYEDGLKAARDPAKIGVPSP